MYVVCGLFGEESQRSDAVSPACSIFLPEYTIFLQITHSLDIVYRTTYSYPVTTSRVAEPTGFDETHPNPVKQLRAHYRMTQESFARKVGMSRMALLRFEQGLPPEPSYKFYIHIPEAGETGSTSGIKANPFAQKILEMYSDDPFVSQNASPKSIAPDDVPVVWKEFVDAYYAYQNAKRQVNYGLLDTNPIFWDGGTLAGRGVHPFIEWLNQSERRPTVTEVCVSFCIHLPVMHKFVNGPFPVDVPPDVLVALRASGYSPELLMEFATVYGERRSRLLRPSGKTALG